MNALAQIVDLVEDKSVAIIGGHLTNLTVGEVLKYDVVIWTNNHWHRMPDAPIHGLFHCCGPLVPADVLINTPRFDQIKFIIGAGFACEAHKFMYYCSSKTVPGLFYGGNPKLYWMYEDLCEQCYLHTCTEPLTGLIAANFVHHLPAASIHLLGMDLYNAYKWTPGIKAHNPVGHAQMFKKLIRNDPRFHACADLITAISSLPVESSSPEETKLD